MNSASIAAEVEGVGGQPVSAQIIHRTLHQIGLHGCRPRRKPLLKMMHKKACKQIAEDKQTKNVDYAKLCRTCSLTSWWLRYQRIVINLMLYPAFWWFVGRPKAVDKGSLLAMDNIGYIL